MAAVPEAAQSANAGLQLPAVQLPGVQLPVLHQPIDEANASEWKAGLCQCDCITCLLGFFVPCYLTGQTAERMRDPTMKTAQPVNMDCLIHCAGAWCRLGFLWVTLKRMAIRQQFNIPGSVAKDVITAYYCPCCATCQQYNEVEARLGPGATGSAQGYQPSQGMVVPPAMQQVPPTGQNPASKEANSVPSAPV